MFQQILKTLVILSLLSMPLKADDTVTNWLSQMGCNDLLALYLEKQLNEGSTQSKVEAAERLASLYAYMLSQSDGSEDEQLLKRANSLLESIPQANTIDLRLQLLRASYLASELTFEKYRLRLVEREEAESQSLILDETARKLESLRASLQRKAKNSKNFTTEDSNRLGLATSLSAWAKYYKAWFKEDKLLANEAADIFATMLEGDSASLQDISLDLRKEEFGARALLGITLCKNLNNIAGEQYTWLEELNHEDTWAGIKQQLPMWTIMMQIDSGEWPKVQEQLTDPLIILEPHTLRLAAVRGIEQATEPSKEVSSIAISQLISESELGIVSQLISKYGNEIVADNPFVSKYLEGELTYREAKEALDADMPSDDPEVIAAFKTAQEQLNAAVNAPNANEYQSVKDDCIYLVGLSQFFSKSFMDAATTFFELGKRTTSEKALWMSIVSLEQIAQLSPRTVLLKNDAVTLYTSLWPNSQKTTQLKLQYPSELADQSTIEELLAIQPSDSNYANARRKVSRLLYQQWGKAKPTERSAIGNTYVGVALPIILEDAKASNEETQQNALVRCLRLLEVALHRDVNRHVAAHQTFDSIQGLAKNGISNAEFQNEIRYREIILLFEENNTTDAVDSTLDLIKSAPDDVWAKHASVYAWNNVATNSDDFNEPVLRLGLYIIKDVSDESLSSPQYVNVAKITSKQALLAYEQSPDDAILEQSKQIAQTLLKSYPNNHEILRLNAKAEQLSGDTDASIAHWNKILDASSKGSNEWLEAKYNTAFLLSKTNLERARVLLDQFAALYPNYGSGEFAAKLKSLHHSIGDKQDGS